MRGGRLHLAVPRPHCGTLATAIFTGAPRERSGGSNIYIRTSASIWSKLYAELMTSEERWRQLFESVPAGVVLIDSHRGYLSVKPAFQRMTGYFEEELSRLSPADITHEDDRAATAAIITANAAGERYAPRIEKRSDARTAVWSGRSSTPF
jgi:PAS domain S-box-containing protein